MPNVRPSRTISYDVSCLIEDEEYTLYTCPQHCRAEMTTLFLANVNGNTSVSVEWYRDNGNRHVHILGGKNLTTGDFILFTEGTAMLEAGDYFTVVATGNASPHIDAFCTVQETFENLY